MRTMVCGSFQECISKRISLDDVDEQRFLKLTRFACGEKGVVTKNVGELFEVCDLAERLQMEAVKVHMEDVLLNELRDGNCVELLLRSEVSGLQRLRKECYIMIRNDFEDFSQKEGFERLSEEMMMNLLEEDELGASQEENVFAAAVRWMMRTGEQLRGDRLLMRIRYGIIGDQHLVRSLLPSLPGHGVLKELVQETIARKGLDPLETGWDGVERLCKKWMVARRYKARVIGADVLSCPEYVAIDLQGRLVVSDRQLNQVIVFDHDGSVARRFGAGNADSDAEDGHRDKLKFNQPMGVAVDQHGHVIVAERSLHVIRVLNEDGSKTHKFGYQSSEKGRLNQPWGIAVDGEGHIVVADSENNRVQVFDVNGTLVRHIGKRGAAVGELHCPMDVAVDQAGRIVVADYGNHRVQVFDRDGSVALSFGSFGDGPGQLNYPCGVAVDNDGRYIVADTYNHRLQVFGQDGNVVVAGGPGVISGQLRFPSGVAVNGDGRIVVVDAGHHRVLVL